MTQEEQDRSQELFELMSRMGLSVMSTDELEEWSSLMAKSLEGKGDPTPTLNEPLTQRMVN